jgi:hypothetical protein
MTAELAKVINDGLYFYEQELGDENDKVFSIICAVNIASR